MENRSIRIWSILLAILSILCFCSLTATAAEDIQPEVIPAEEEIPVVVTPVVADYGIWVGSVKVTPENKDNITGSGITLGEDGYIRYNSETKTLTMKNAVITSCSEQPMKWIPDTTYLCGLVGSAQLKTLEILGENEISLDVGGADVQVYGVTVDHIAGGGSLSVSVVNAAGNCYGIEAGKLTVNNTALKISVESLRDAEPTSTNLIGIRVPSGMTVNNSTVSITAGDAKNNSFGIDSMHDIFFNDSVIEITTGSAKFSTDAITAMAHPMDGIVVGLTMRGGSLSVSAEAPAMRFGYLDMGTDAWYKYAVNRDARTPAEIYTDSANTPLTAELLTDVQNVQIVPRETDVRLYADIQSEDWYYEDVQYASDHGLMKGTGEGNFSPDMMTDRSMLVTVLWRIEGSPAITEDGTEFDDVAADKWYYTPILWAAQQGLVLGAGDGSYNPTGSLTREQVALILHRYALQRDAEKFGAAAAQGTDTSAYVYSAWAKDGITWAASIGLFDGLGVDVTDLTAGADRAEIAAYLHRFCEYIA